MHSSCRKFSTLILALTAWCAQSIAADNAEALKAYLPSGCYHGGHYQQERTLAGLAQPLATEGSFAYSCDRGLIWHTADPVTETVIYKATGKHFLLDGENNLNPLEGRVHQALGTLLNHLIGGDAAYLTRHFHAEIKDEYLRLVPRQSRLKKFIQNIEINPRDDKVEIRLQHPADETTQITITGQQVFETFDMARCKALLPEQTIACGTLFL